METNNNLHQQAVDMMTWGLLHDLSFKNILNKVNVDQVHNAIYRFLKKKIEDKELSVEDIDEIADNIRAKAEVLFDRIGDDWGRGDDGCYDIAIAAVAFGKQNYEKCLKDHDYLVSMREATKEYENVLYPFNDIIEENKKQNDAINESLAISDEVKNETIKLAKQIRDDVLLNITKQKNDAIGTSIENIDKFNENLFNNLITKNAFLIRLQKAYNRYKTKIEKVVQKVNDEYLKNNEGAYINSPSHNAIKNLKNKINEEQTLWFKK